ncbi:MAG: hypothetical protein ACI8PZ_003343 [Myxococcota bacterium]|jgi:uncharacterized protein YaeQ
MPSGSTVYTVDLEIADVDRGVYASESLRLARHPSEAGDWLVARVLAFALEYGPDLRFSRGLASGDEPALWRHDPTGRLVDWIEVGTPDAARLHKASKAAESVSVYCHKDPERWLRSLSGQRVHQAESIGLFCFDRGLVSAMAAALERRSPWSVTRTEGVLYVAVGDLTRSAPLTELLWPQ